MTQSVQSICVFCGSRDGKNPAYHSAALDFGAQMAGENWRLVYGAGDVGIMGAVAQATQDAGGDTFGVIPTHLVKREVAKLDLARIVITENMHERKKVMFMNSDAIVVLPGGAGSLDEFFEVLTWRQLGLHDKPIWVLNVAGFWDPLMALVDHCVIEGFAERTLRDFVSVASDVPELVTGLRADLS